MANSAHRGFRVATLIGALVAALLPIGWRAGLPAAAATGGYTPLAAPLRLLDTRVGPAAFDGREEWDGLQGPASRVALPVAGRAGVPLGGSVSVVLNVTVTGAVGEGYLTVWPCDAGQPNASNLNFVAGDTVANNVIAKVAGDGSVCLFASAPANLIVDVSGHFADASVFAPLGAPARVLDTRFNTATVDGRFGAVGARRGQSSLALPVAGRAGVPSSATAVVLNVTATGVRRDGYLTVFAGGQMRPEASNLNSKRGDTTPNSVIAKVGGDGTVCLFTEGVTDLIVDVAGYLVGGPTAGGSATCADPTEPSTVPVLTPGTYAVGSEIAPGRYRSTMNGDECVWQRRNAIGFPLGVSSPFRMIGPVVVDIRAGDSSFVLQVGCGRLRPWAATQPPSDIATPGYWVVNADLQPGQYRSSVNALCSYARVRSFDGNYFDENTTIDSDTFISPQIAQITIASTDAGFITTPACGVWERVG